jgi:hypothetical protein
MKGKNIKRITGLFSILVIFVVMLSFGKSPGISHAQEISNDLTEGVLAVIPDVDSDLRLVEVGIINDVDIIDRYSDTN